MRRTGFTLVELSTAMAILSVVSLLSFVVLRTSTQTADLSRAKSQIQGEIRDVMTAVSNRVQEAVTQRLTNVTGAPEDLFPIAVSQDGHSVTFQVPAPADGADLYAFSDPITIALESEDQAEGTGDPNGKLDDGEDANGDGVLTRRVTLTQGEVTTTLASANNISNLQFELLEHKAAGNTNLTTLRIWVEASATYGAGERSQLIKAELESQIHLMN